MQNSLNKEGNIVEFTSNKTTVTDVMKGSTAANSEFLSQISKLKETQKGAQIKPLKASCVYVIKKYVTRVEFDN